MISAAIDFYKQNLETEISEKISERKGVSLEVALDAYYRSALSSQISKGEYGIENLSPGYLANDLIENESELFQTNGRS